jgi:hypothetical protein
MAHQLIYQFATPLFLSHWTEAEQYESLFVDAVRMEISRAERDFNVQREQESPSVTTAEHQHDLMLMSVAQIRRNKSETFGDFHLRNDSIRPFFLWCLDGYRTLLTLLAPQCSTAFMPKMTNCWASVYRKGDYHRTHNHPMSAFSGVYCVRTPELTLPDGTLDFHDPRPQVNYYQPIVPLFGDDLRSVSLRAGDLVIFPGWLKHSVNPFFVDGERITISINFDYQTTAHDSLPI